MKRIFAFLMVIVTITVIIPGTIAFAISHTHSWKKMAEQVNSYSNINDSTHTVNVIEYFKCTKDNCLDTITGKAQRTVSHSFQTTSTNKPIYQSTSDDSHLVKTKMSKKCACGKTKTEWKYETKPHNKYQAEPIRENNLIVGYKWKCTNCGWTKKVYK